MSFFPPFPAVLAIAALNRQHMSRRPGRPHTKAVPALSAPIVEEAQTATVSDTAETVAVARHKQKRRRPMPARNLAQTATALSDMAHYMGNNPRAAQMAQTFKAMSMLNEQPQPQVQSTMTPQQRTMGVIKTMGSLMGNSGRLPPVLNMLVGGGGSGGLLSMLGGGSSGGLGSLLSLLGGARNLGPLMSILGSKGKKSSVQPLPADMMDRVNSMLAGMDDKKKEELLNMARSLLSSNGNMAQ